MNPPKTGTYCNVTLLKGLGYGLVTVSCWGIMNVSTHDALRNGFLPNDLTMLRYCVAGAICLPLLLVSHRKVVGPSNWLKAVALALLAGPLYGSLVNMGMQVTPLSYASVMVPTFTMIITMLLSMKSEKLNKIQTISTLVIVLGLYALMNDTPNTLPQSSMGVVAFLLAGLTWSCFTILLKHWKVEPVSTIFMMNLVSGVIYLPFYFLNEHSTLSDLSIAQWVVQGFVQSVLASIVVVFAFAQTVKYIGVTVSSTLPALIPVTSILIATLLFGHAVTTSEKLTLGLISFGFVTCTLSKHKHHSLKAR
ncbi:membrane hypothetical protein [Vibrio nigripulchritudo SFn27]|uniref:Permease of the drug/metabolite transporter (DMT) superfamily n=1 Tax=Vibrio nigripulchritudo TaxID=28173 RepID=A0A9P1JLB0_9VIBR|nr:DMT family transporter [Vibrio nigripulchritudo]CBJ93118.1 putative Permease of the drug/metabolite transporter (DMT) superfamily [Vibrio nigripulchritudo]CCN85933.1 membrane hypothetical protein [Vibrio nigripulchritudo BLFn1]CCN91930.1 membrane hypothetical protein [Vibrio nigripulchritudo SFn27]CCN97730.1 membrane hypothetical protein [Vibrio nigripulchritudo ENn2]CCO43964.1 membrane hypothetical protein [Vibrio nigripulchritudo SFn135]